MDFSRNSQLNYFWEKTNQFKFDLIYLKDYSKFLEHSFKRLERSFKRLERSFKRLEHSFKRLEHSFKRLERSFKRLERSFKRLERSFKRLDAYKYYFKEHCYNFKCLNCKIITNKREMQGKYLRWRIFYF